MSVGGVQAAEDAPRALLPRYGGGALSDLVPALLASLAGGDPAPLELPPATAAVLLLVDGLGAELLDRYAADAPFLHQLSGGAQRLTACFPSTTATSITSLGTGLPPGQHGVVGYRLATPRRTGVLNMLRWEVDEGDRADLPEPDAFRMVGTAFETTASVAAYAVAPPYQKRSGLTRLALAGMSFVGARAVGDLVAGAVAAAGRADRDHPALVYAYHGDLDLLGHLHGPGSPPWRYQLRAVDRLAEMLAAALPPASVLVVTGDHGMVAVGADAPVDLDARPDLMAGVQLVAGEPRARHVYVEAGATQDVLDAWRAELGDRMWVLAGDEAVAAGWFGPVVSPAARPRIGDVVAAAHGDVAVVRRTAQPFEAALLGHHGSLTPAEQLVPLLVAPHGTGWR